MELKTTCPWCNRRNDLTSQVEKAGSDRPDAEAHPGDLIMCVTCGKFALFDEDMELRRPTRAEVVEIGLDPKCRAMIAAWRQVQPEENR